VRFSRVSSSVFVIAIVFFSQSCDTYAVGFEGVFLFLTVRERVDTFGIGNHGHFILFVITLALSLLLKFSYM
jgi:hypothetical protein